MNILKFIRTNAFAIAFAQALVGMLGSLYFSEIRHFAPCVLCWYQRIALYPIVLIAAFAIWQDDKKADRYILPLAGIGLAISVYHNLLYYKFIPEAIQPCTFGVSCTTPLISWLGFITIPFLSMLGFAVIVASMVIYRRTNKEIESMLD